MWFALGRENYPEWVAVLIDPPLWPAHGGLWSHLVSDESYDELHRFARRVPLPRRAFDLDHYDVPESLYHRLIELGATPVGTRDVVHRLRDSGLRVRHVDRAAERPLRRRQYLQLEWAELAGGAGLPRSSSMQTRWLSLGGELLARWNEPSRSYHDERHLEDVLLSLDLLATRGERLDPATLLAAWFHDAIYTGRGPDEHDSARLAVAALADFDLAPSLVRHVGELIEATVPAAAPARQSASLGHLLDADLAIFASSEARYAQYAQAVRVEYAHVPEPEFREGRAAILRGYLAHPSIYRTPVARQLWEQRARENLAAEVARLLPGAE